MRYMIEYHFEKIKFKSEQYVKSYSDHSIIRNLFSTQISFPWANTRIVIGKYVFDIEISLTCEVKLEDVESKLMQPILLERESLQEFNYFYI